MVPCPSLSQKSSLCARTVQEEATEEADRISSHGTERKEGEGSPKVTDREI